MAGPNFVRIFPTRSTEPPTTNTTYDSAAVTYDSASQIYGGATTQDGAYPYNQAIEDVYPTNSQVIDL